MNTCSSCKYFVDGGEDTFDACHRYPATLFVSRGYWCGEYAPIRDVALDKEKRDLIMSISSHCHTPTQPQSPSQDGR